MADFTTEEKDMLKKIAAKQQLEKDIVDINTTASAAISTKQDEINALEAKRLQDVQAKEDAITALGI